MYNLKKDLSIPDQGPTLRDLGTRNVKRPASNSSLWHPKEARGGSRFDRNNQSERINRRSMKFTSGNPTLRANSKLAF